MINYFFDIFIKSLTSKKSVWAENSYCLTLNRQNTNGFTTLHFACIFYFWKFCIVDFLINMEYCLTLGF